MGIVLFLRQLIASGFEESGICNDNVVAAVGRWIERRFVFAHEDKCDLGCHPAEGEGRIIDFDVVPYARVGETGLQISGG